MNREQKKAHDRRVARFLEQIVKPTHIITLASENPATADDLAQVFDYGFERFSREVKQHVFWFVAGDEQPIRRANHGGKKLYHHLHGCFRLELSNDYPLWFINHLLSKSMEASAKRSVKKFYTKTAKEAGNCALFSKESEACAQLQYDLKVNVDVQEYGQKGKEGFEFYTVTKHDDLKIGYGCPRRKNKCNRVIHEVDPSGKKVKGRGKRVCGLEDGDLLSAINQPK